MARHREAARRRWPLIEEAEPHELDVWASHAARRDTAARAELAQGVIGRDGRVLDVSARLPQWEGALLRRTRFLDAREAWFAGETVGRQADAGTVEDLQLDTVEETELRLILRRCERADGSQDLSRLTEGELVRVRELISVGDAHARPHGGCERHPTIDCDGWCRRSPADMRWQDHKEAEAAARPFDCSDGSNDGLPEVPASGELLAAPPTNPLR